MQQHLSRLGRDGVVQLGLGIAVEQTAPHGVENDGGCQRADKQLVCLKQDKQVKYEQDELAAFRSHPSLLLCDAVLPRRRMAHASYPD